MFGLLLLVSACDSWPSSESKARKHFVENRESFDRLAEKMHGAEYRQVFWSYGETDVQVWLDAEADHEGNVIVDDDPEWRELLANVRVFWVLQSDGAVSIHTTGLWADDKNQEREDGFTHDPNMLEKYKICRPEHEEIPCGRCAIRLEGDWFIHYGWRPRYLLKEERVAEAKGESLSDKDLDARYEAMRQCFIDGYTKMGYDVEKIFDLETGLEEETVAK